MWMNQDRYTGTPDATSVFFLTVWSLNFQHCDLWCTAAVVAILYLIWPVMRGHGGGTEISQRKRCEPTRKREERVRKHTGTGQTLSPFTHTGLPLFFTWIRAQCGFQTQRLLSTLPEYSGNWPSMAIELYSRFWFCTQVCWAEQHSLNKPMDALEKVKPILEIRFPQNKYKSASSSILWQRRHWKSWCLKHR